MLDLLALTRALATYSQDIVNWCTACVVGDVVDDQTFNSHFRNTIKASRFFDWLSLFFASFMVAVTVVKELRDILFVNLVIEDIEEDPDIELDPRWIAALKAMQHVRRFVFVPLLIFAAVFLVVFDGGDAKSVCMNTVALLFLADIDDLAYEIALSEKWRTRMEEAGHVELDPGQAEHLARTKLIHIVLLTVAIPLGVKLFGTIGGPWWGSVVLFSVFLMGAVEENRQHKNKTLPGATETSIAWVVGIAGCVLLYFLSKT